MIFLFFLYQLSGRHLPGQDWGWPKKRVTQGHKDRERDREKAGVAASFNRSKRKRWTKKKRTTQLDLSPEVERLLHDCWCDICFRKPRQAFCHCGCSPKLMMSSDSPNKILFLKRMRRGGGQGQGGRWGGWEWDRTVGGRSAKRKHKHRGPKPNEKRTWCAPEDPTRFFPSAKSYPSPLSYHWTQRKGLTFYLHGLLLPEYCL